MNMNTIDVRSSQKNLCLKFEELKELISKFEKSSRLSPEVSDSVRKDIDNLALSTVVEFENLIRYLEVNDPKKARQIGEIAHRNFLPYLLATETAARFYLKPYGYAGDYLTIDHIYENKVGGVGEYGKMIDTILLKYPQAEAVRNRRNVLKELINSLHMNESSELTRITSLACGPAREVFDVLEESPLAHNIEFTLLDLDQGALDLIKSRLSTLNKAINVKKIRANLVSVAAGRKKLGLERQDLIYSVGLIDYFDDKFVIKLLNWTFENLKTGGQVVLGNFHSDNPAKAFMDYIFEWKLIHRSEDDMRRIFSQTPFGDCSSIFLEESGVNMFAKAVRN